MREGSGNILAVKKEDGAVSGFDNFRFGESTDYTIGSNASNVILREVAAWVLAAQSDNGFMRTVLRPQSFK